MSPLTQQTILIRGKVQGVGFRYSAQHQALRHELRGFVRNRADGCVEVVAQGEGDKLEAFVVWCRQGPAAARVRHVDIRFDTVEEIFTTFEIRETL